MQLFPKPDDSLIITSSSNRQYSPEVRGRENRLSGTPSKVSSRFSRIFEDFFVVGVERDQLKGIKPKQVLEPKLLYSYAQDSNPGN